MTKDPDEEELLLLEMARALHEHLPEDQRPIARMEFSDEQWERLKAAAKVVQEHYLKREDALDLLHDGSIDDPNNKDWRGARVMPAASDLMRITPADYEALGRACADRRLAWWEGVEMCFIPTTGPAGVTAEDAAAEQPSLCDIVSQVVARQPVAWRVKDFADGWILCHSAEEACLEAEGAGNLVEPLYR